MDYRRGLLSGCVPVGIGDPLGAHDLVDSTELVPLLDLILLVLDLLPALVLPIQHLDSLPFQLRLPSRLLVLSPHLLVRGEILLKALEGYIWRVRTVHAVRGCVLGLKQQCCAGSICVAGWVLRMRWASCLDS